MARYLNIMIIKNFYKIFFYFILIITFLLFLTFVFYKYNPDLLSKYFFNRIIPHELKVIIRKNFIEKNLKKHINTYSKNQFIELKLDKVDLGFDYDRSSKVNYKVYNNYSHIDIWKNKLFLANHDGDFYFFDLDRIHTNRFLKQKIDTNLKSLSNSPYHGVKDILINEDKIYVAYVIEQKKNCLSIFIDVAEISNENLNFKNFFGPDECVAAADTLYKKNHPGQAGGRLAKYKDNKLLLTTGNFRSPKVSQNLDSIYGKTLSIDQNSNVEILSLGHRNPQGLYTDGDLIIQTEHGPYGGDEINLIISGGNYGFPIASFGEKYSYKKNQDNFDYLKNHDGFIEPIFSFVPSVGISQIIALPNNFNKKWQNNYLLSSLNGNSLYRLKLSKDKKKLLFYETIYFGERIRDLVYYNDKKIILMIFEETGTLAILSNK